MNPFKPGDLVYLARPNSMPVDMFTQWKGLRARVVDPENRNLVQDHLLAYYRADENVILQPVDVRPDRKDYALFVFPFECLEFADKVTDDDVDAAIESIKRAFHE